MATKQNRETKTNSIKHPENLKTVRKSVIQKYLEELTSTENTNYSLWRAIRNIKQSKQAVPPIKNTADKRARKVIEKTRAFGEYQQKVFEPPIEEKSDWKSSGKNISTGTAYS